MVQQKQENVNHFTEVKNSQIHIHLLQRKNTVFIFIVRACQSLSCVQLFVIPQLQLARLLCPQDSPGKNTRVDCHSLLQRIFPTHRLNPGLLRCRQILYHLSYKEAPVIFIIHLVKTIVYLVHFKYKKTQETCISLVYTQLIQNDIRFQLYTVLS